MWKVPIVAGTTPHEHEESPVMTSSPVTQLGGAGPVLTERSGEESSQDQAGISQDDSNSELQVPLSTLPAQPREMETTPDSESERANTAPAMVN